MTICGESTVPRLKVRLGLEKGWLTEARNVALAGASMVPGRGHHAREARPTTRARFRRRTRCRRTVRAAVLTVPAGRFVTQLSTGFATIGDGSAKKD